MTLFKSIARNMENMKMEINLVIIIFRNILITIIKEVIILWKRSFLNLKR